MVGFSDVWSMNIFLPPFFQVGDTLLRIFTSMWRKISQLLACQLVKCKTRYALLNNIKNNQSPLKISKYITFLNLSKYIIYDLKSSKKLNAIFAF